MATTTIPWGDGSGDNIYLTYSSASGNQTVEVTSDANTGAARSKAVTFTPGGEGVAQQLTINQAAHVVTIPYIRGGGDGSYIDTGITPNNTVKVVIWARNFNPTAGTTTTLIGSQKASNNSALVVYAGQTTNTGRIAIRFANAGTTYISDMWGYFSHYHKYELGPDGFLIDDTLLSSVSQTTFSNNLNIHLFGFNDNGTHAGGNSNTCPIDICACKIYKNGVLVRDFTPVSSPSIGFYDAVSDTIFTNVGSGSFTFGMFDPNAYTPLEYIECDKRQYFDTGLYGSDASKVVTKFRLTNSTKTYSRLFGCRNDGDSSMYELMIGNTSVANRYFYMRYKGTATTVYNSAAQTNEDLIYTASGNTFALYKNYSALRTATGATGTFTTPFILDIGTSNIKGTHDMTYAFYGRIYYISLDVQHVYVPAKVSNVVGMYDTYNDVFHPSESGTDFIAGTPI